MTLDEQMDFDHVVRVHPDGTVTDTDIWAPCLYDGELDQPPGGGWSLMDGYSDQDRYSGPIMHASEFIGEGCLMERDILASPGLYVCLVDYLLDDEDAEPDGWAVAYKRENESSGE